MTKVKKTSEKKQVNNDIVETLDVPEHLPVVPLDGIVPYPAVVMGVVVSDSFAINALTHAAKESGLVLLVAEKRVHNIGQYSSDDLYNYGVVASLVRAFKTDDGKVKVIAQGIVKAKVKEFNISKDAIKAKIELTNQKQLSLKNKKVAELVTAIKQNIEALIESGQAPEEMSIVLDSIDDPVIISYLVFSHFRPDYIDGETLLESEDSLNLLETASQMVVDHLKATVIMREIRERTQEALSEEQNQYFLREQLNQIQKALGMSTTSTDELASIKTALKNAKLPDETRIEAEKQMARLERMNPETSEYAMLRTYLELIVDLPWGEKTEDKIDVIATKKRLDADHFGLEQPKDRILEYLSVKKLKQDSKGPILCFVGPPGVGKTSLGRSIATSLNRKFFRMSLGGVRDEAEIRGHRRTYVGSLPGRIIQGIKEAKSCNPVFVLDELDKVGADYRGDPAAALLEILDPEQNKQFRDHYLNVPFDLSDVLFIATANTVDTIPSALLDRLEVIYISGYTTEEKVHIAKKFLIPRELKAQGLDKQKITFEKDAIIYVIEHYTREAGVRNLDRELASLCRKLARQYVESGKLESKVTIATVERLFGATKYDPDEGVKEDSVGIANGLAWTTQGGEVMPIEAQIASGRGELTLTGQLGNVMQESARAAMFYARANASKLGIDPDFYQHTDIHIHVPHGATPKDGPSAGVTIVTTLVSALANKKISKDLAMTGEITLRGQVLAVGGIREKALAAIRQGVKRIILPAENAKDLEEIPQSQRKKVKFILVHTIEEVLKNALK